MSEVPSITLRGAAPHTANMARIMPDGSLEVELFDFSPEAHQWLGNDVAYIVRVSPQDAPAVAARLLGQPAPSPLPVQAVLAAIQSRFAGYYEFLAWLDSEHIPYAKDFDGRA